MKKFILLLLLINYNYFFAQEISVNSYTDKQKYLLGDYITYSLEIKCPQNYEVAVPKMQDSIKQLEYIKSGKLTEEKINNKIILTQKFIFSKYEADTLIIPEIKIVFKEKSTNKILFVSTSQIEIIITAYDVKDSKDIVDIKKPVKVPFDWLLVFYAILALCGFAIIAFFVWKYWIKKKLNPLKDVKIILPPYQIALNRLAELESEKLWQQGKIKEFHSDITKIIRKYFENEFLFNALEMTSGEICSELAKNKRTKTILQIVEKFFTNADMVKFAKFHPLPSINEEMLTQAYEIVNKTNVQFQEKENADV